MSILGFAEGETEFGADACYAATILNLCMKNAVYYESCGIGERFQIVCRGRYGGRIRTLCEKNGIPLSVVRQRGLPFLFLRFRRRYGIFAGILAGVTVLLLAENVVWNVRVTGNDAVPEKRITELLAENGIAVGTRLSGMDSDEAETRLLLAEPDLSWVALTVSGTTVNVEVRETKRGSVGGYTGANLTATEDGVIESVEATDELVLVHPGDVVRQGQLLVSGVYDNVYGGTRVTRASGVIRARVTRNYRIEIPLTVEKKVYTGENYCEKTVKFFGKNIKVFSNAGKMGTSCDIIYAENMLSLPGGGKLPVGIATTRYLGTATEMTKIDEKAAAQLAFFELGRKLGEMSAEAEMISKEISFEFKEDTDTFVLNCRTVCIENIACQKEIGIIR